jgi:hypothetical protein
LKEFIVLRALLTTIQKVRQKISTTRILQNKLGKMPNNTKSTTNNTVSTTKLSYIRELVATARKPSSVDEQFLNIYYKNIN